jgi:hypothetical protein
MDNSILRRYIRNILSEFRNSAGAYTYGPNKFPYLNGTDATTPSDLSAEFDSEFSEEKESDTYSFEVPTFDGNKKGYKSYKIPKKH